MSTPQDPFTLALARQIRIALDDAPHLRFRKDLETATGIPFRSLKRYLDGEREIPLLALRSIASALHVPLSDLVDRAESSLDQ
ncbi:helix-turn-helix domain-containing protein [Micrococcus luteus]|nr:helix-turn-helix domain-containing protein [Micrococcus luteus]MCV7573658.1 helix-turn-helix domain-containing protein [Micrococcus luteus]